MATEHGPDLETLKALAQATQERLDAGHAHVQNLEWTISLLIALSAAMATFGGSPTSSDVAMAGRVFAAAASLALLAVLVFSRHRASKETPLSAVAFDRWVNEPPAAVIHALNRLRRLATARLADLAEDLTLVVHVGFVAVVLAAGAIVADTLFGETSLEHNGETAAIQAETAD
ncbi:MAG: hypothetical protein M3O70_03595 [Actinomycetota bacterium]|nr:hypothetical protein [Actinomycetota bacterium]